MVVQEEMPFEGAVKADQDIVVTKWIGLEGSARILAAREEQLNKRFPKAMLDSLRLLAAALDMEKEAALAMKSGASAQMRLSWGGIYSALYRLAKAAGVGLEIDLRAIPIRQETVELCEYLGLNPYYLHSGGSMILVCDHGYRLVQALEKEGICGAVIGRTTADRAKAVINEGHLAYLERPKKDELKKLLGEAKGNR